MNSVCAGTENEVLPCESEQLRLLRDAFADKRNLNKKLAGRDGSELSRLAQGFFDDVEERIKAVIKQTILTSRSTHTVEQVMGELSGMIRQQAVTAQEITTAMGTFADQIQSVSAATEELSASATQAAGSAASGNTLLEQFFTGLEAIAVQIDQTSRFMEKMAESVQSISDIADLVEKISAQLQLLSINASIEAARSGQHGRGFAVVATEIRRLSDSTAAAMKQVQQITHRVQSETGDVARAVEGSRTAVDKALEGSTELKTNLKEIVDAFVLFEQAVQSIAESLDQQLSVVQQIHTATENASDMAGRSAELIEQAQRQTHLLHETVDHLVAGAGVFQVSWHETSTNSLSGLVAGREMWRLPPHVQQEVLAAAFGRYPFFELFYVMDAGGRQVTDNIVNPRYSSQISAAGRGMDRSGKLYFSEVRQGIKPYVSDVYLSSATRSFCITVAVPLVDPEGRFLGVVAGDININDLIQMEHGGQ